MDAYRLTILLADTNPAAGLSSARVLAIVLWVGLAILSVSLLILMRTRWGQAKPLSKCVVLSVFAHLLLATYAYGTKLFFDYPAADSEEVVQLTIVPTGEQSDLPSQQRDPPRQPWDKLASDEPPAAPALAPNERMQTMDQQVLQRDHQAQARIPAIHSAPQAELREPQWSRPLPDNPAASAPRVSSSNLQAAALAAPSAARQADSAPAPGRARLERIRTDEAAADTPQRTADSKLPSELFDVGSRLQRLSEVPAAVDSSASAGTDQLRQAANQESTGRSGRARGAQTPADGSDPAASDQVAGDAVPGPLASQPDATPHASSGALSERASAPRRLGDGEPVPDSYRHRVGGNRRALAGRFGGNEQSEAAVEAALAWLAANQSSDGRWRAQAFGGGQETQVLGHNRNGAGAEADTGISGLALLAFLAAGHTHYEGQYRKHVQHGLEFLLASQKQDGNLAGSARLYAMMYCHGMASLAVSEAYALTGDHRMKPFVQRAVDYTVNAQHPSSGGWRYQPGDQGDMSQFGWQVMALKSAQLAGLELPTSTSAGMRRFLQSTSSGRYGGLASYRAGEAPSRTMTAESLACRFFLDLETSPQTLDEATTFLLGDLPSQGKANMYYWYYASLALHQAQGAAWQTWNRALQQQLLQRQRTDGQLAGSWDTDTVWGGYGGRVYTTALAALCLEVYYRYLPLQSTAP